MLRSLSALGKEYVSSNSSLILPEHHPLIKRRLKILVLVFLTRFSPHTLPMGASRKQFCTCSSWFITWKALCKKVLQSTFVCDPKRPVMLWIPTHMYTLQDPAKRSSPPCVTGITIRGTTLYMQVHDISYLEPISFLYTSDF